MLHIYKWGRYGITRIGDNVNKKTSILAAVIVAVIVTVIVSVYAMMPVEPERVHEDIEVVHVDVVMPTKVSRPGCELEDRCYIPSVISIDAGKSVSWLNDDSAFHSVTSGPYGNHDGLFDSEYMDPEDIFTFTFDESGEYVYHCTLHEWMQGVVLVN